MDGSCARDAMPRRANEPVEHSEKLYATVVSKVSQRVRGSPRSMSIRCQDRFERSPSLVTFVEQGFKHMEHFCSSFFCFDGGLIFTECHCQCLAV